MNSNSDTNFFKAKGRIVSIRDGRDADTAIVTLIIKNDYRDVYPEIRCKKSMIPEHKAHGVFEIKGYISSEPSGRTGREVPRLYATSIVLADTLLGKVFGAKGRFWEPESCYFYISGEIKEIKEDTNDSGTYIRYYIKTTVPATGEETSLRVDWKKIDRHPEFKVGDRVCAACKINTPKKKIGSETRHFLNLDVFDMALAEAE